MAAPTLIGYSDTNWNSSTAKSTGVLTWQAGDLIVVVGGSENTTSVSSITAPGLTFTAGTPLADPYANTWTAVAGAPGSGTIDVTQNGGGWYGIAAWVFRGAGIGARASDLSTSKGVGLTRTGTNSAVVTIIIDWGAGATTGLTWTPAGATQRVASQVSAATYGVYVADWGDQGSAGTTTYGITGTPSTAPHANIALEVTGTGPTAPAVTYVSASSGTSAAGTLTSFPVTLPAGWAAGDVIVLFGSVSATTLTMTTPAGWTAIPGITWPTNQATNSRLYGWYRVMQAGDTAPTITASGATTGGWTAQAFRGANPAAPIGAAGINSASATSVALPSLTGITAGSMLAVGTHARVATGTIPTNITPNAAYTETTDVATSRTTTNANVRVEAAYRATPAAGTYGGESFTSSITASMIAALVEVLAAPTGSTVSGDATLGVTATIDAAAVRALPAAGSLAVTAGITATGARTLPAGASLPITAAVGGTAAVAGTGGASLPVAASIAAAATLTGLRLAGTTATGTTGTGTTANHTITTPACAPGDLLVASITLNGGHGAVTEAGGWTRAYPPTITDDGLMTLAVYTRTADAADAAGGAVHTWQSATPVRSNRGCAAITGQATAPIAAQVPAVGSGTAVNTAITPGATGCLILSLLALDSGTENASPSAPLIEQWDPAGAGTNTGQVNAAATTKQADAATTSYGWTWTTSLAYKHLLLAVAPAGAITADASLPAVATITAGGTRSAPGSASLAATAAITAGGSAGRRAGASLPATATITAAAATGAVSGLGITAALTATARAGRTADATLAATATAIAGGRAGARSGAGIAATAAIATGGTAAYAAAAALPCEAAIDAAAERLAPYEPALYGIDSGAGVWLTPGGTASTSFMEGRTAGAGLEGASITSGALG